MLIYDISDHFPIFFNRKNFFCTNSSKNVNKGVHYRLVNQNTLSALDEMLALTNFDEIISNVNINEAKQLLFDRINKFCPVNKLTFSKWSATYVFVCINDLTI